MKEQSLQHLLTMEEPLEPETIKALGIAENSEDVQKVLVLRLLKKSELPYENLYVFENCVHVLNGLEADIDQLEGSKPEHIWYTLEKIDQMHGEVELSYEVRKYIEFNFRDTGHLFFPPKSGIVNPDWFDEVKEIANDVSKHPINPEISPFNVQVIKYMRIQEYLNRFN